MLAVSGIYHSFVETHWRCASILPSTAFYHPAVAHVCQIPAKFPELLVKHKMVGVKPGQPLNDTGETVPTVQGKTAGAL
jgi:hypothetical protein